MTTKAACISTLNFRTKDSLGVQIDTSYTEIFKAFVLLYCHGYVFRTHCTTLTLTLVTMPLPHSQIHSPYIPAKCQIEYPIMLCIVCNQFTARCKASKSNIRSFVRLDQAIFPVITHSPRTTHPSSLSFSPPSHRTSQLHPESPSIPSQTSPRKETDASTRPDMGRGQTGWGSRQWEEHKCNWRRKGGDESAAVSACECGSRARLSSSKTEK